MLLSILIILVLIFYIFSVILASSSVYGDSIHNNLKQLKKILNGRYVGRTDRFDDALNYLRLQSLSDDDLDKLKSLIQIQINRVNVSIQYNSLVASVFVTFVTLLVGTIISATFGGLFGTLSNSMYENKMEIARTVFYDLQEFSYYASFNVGATFIIGILLLGTWGNYTKYWPEILAAALRVVEKEQETRIYEKQENR